MNCKFAHEKRGGNGGGLFVFLVLVHKINHFNKFGTCLLVQEDWSRVVKIGTHDGAQPRSFNSCGLLARDMELISARLSKPIDHDSARV